MPACQAAVRQVCFDTVTVMTAAARAMDQDNAMRLRRRLLQEPWGERTRLAAAAGVATGASAAAAAAEAAAAKRREWFTNFRAKQQRKQQQGQDEEVQPQQQELGQEPQQAPEQSKLEDLIKIARSDVESISWLLRAVCKVADMNSSALGGGKSNPKGRPGKNMCSSASMSALHLYRLRRIVHHVWLWKRENWSLLLSEIEMYVDQGGAKRPSRSAANPVVGFSLSRRVHQCFCNGCYNHVYLP